MMTPRPPTNHHSINLAVFETHSNATPSTYLVPFLSLLLLYLCSPLTTYINDDARKRVGPLSVASLFGNQIDSRIAVMQGNKLDASTTLLAHHVATRARAHTHTIRLM